MKARRSSGAAICFATAIVASHLLSLPTELAAAEPLADVAVDSTLVTFQPRFPFDTVRVTLTGPADFEKVLTFGTEETPAVELPGLDGLYKYELRFSPLLDKETRELMTSARKRGLAPVNGGDRATDKRTVQRGWFSLLGGRVVPRLTEEVSTNRSAAEKETVLGNGNPEVVLTGSDGVIRNSLCVGFDCPDAPAFDDSTILLMENNTRIKFGDTSNAPFPNNDWEIEANSSLSGGPNYLGFNDCGSADNDGGCATDLVFAVESGARASALYVEDDGDIGIGTSNPILDLHIVTGNTPALRLDQDGSSGFTPQVWDIAGNETNFFIRDVTAGSRLPLRIRPLAPTSSIDISASGDVGFGTATPGRALHIVRTDATSTGFVVENKNAAPQNVIFDITNTARSWRFRAQSTGNFEIIDSTGNIARWRINGATGQTDITGNLVISGSCTAGGVPCDLVFDPETPIESIEEHAAYMWKNSHLPGVGPTPVDSRWDIGRKGAGMLNELEKAHIYIEQLHKALQEQQLRTETQQAEIAELRRLVEGLSSER